MTYAVKDGRIQEVDDQEIDIELPSANSFLSIHGNTIPMQSGVQAPRVFYGSRFLNQALPLVNPEAPLVQTKIDGQDRSFDQELGKSMGAVFSDRLGRVLNVDNDHVELEDPETGETWTKQLYNNFLFNRKTSLHSTPSVKQGDMVEPGQLLARSNYTDDKGTLAMSVNARIGLVPYKGYSMDDAVVISQSLANRLTSRQTYVEDQEFDGDVKGGKNHFHSLFPTAFKQTQLKKLDAEGVARAGQILEKGDPYVLATKPRMFTSQAGSLGKLSRAMQQTRQDASLVWDHNEPGTVQDVVRTKKGVKVVIDTETPVMVGDKLTERHGNKGVVSKILSDEEMPRTVDGLPLEMLLNPLGIPSRVNSAMVYDILLGKVAKKRGEGYNLPAFNKPGEKWYDFVEQQLAEHGIDAEERVFDPMEQRELENPITVGYAPVMKLHHMASSKLSGRSQGSYSMDEQPLKGGSDAAQAKRLSGLERNALISSGAYATLRESSTIRGQRNDDFWKAVRSGHTPREPGSPFVWDKFQALLQGSGMLARDLGGGKLRLGPFTDKSLAELKPRTLDNADSVNPDTLEPVAGGLFDPVLVGGGRWGAIDLDTPVPNPAFEKQIAQLLGVREKDVRRVVAGELDLEEAQK